MHNASRSLSCSCVLLSLALVYGSMPACALDGEASPTISGKVLSSSAKGPHTYQVETDNRIYLLMCEKTGGFHLGLPECKIGDKPIAIGDTLQFRVDGDHTYIPSAKGGEQALRVLTVELKAIPAMPRADASAKPSAPGSERGVVIGTGMHISGSTVGWSTAPTASGMASGPVMAIPVTGGAPVMVIPAGPVGGGVVTGVPVTGGAPIVGMPLGGAPHATAGAPIGGGPVWVHILRVNSGGRTYQLECSRKPCELDKKTLDLGDTLIIRTEKKWAYLSSAENAGGKEQKLRLLNVEDAKPAADSR